MIMRRILMMSGGAVGKNYYVDATGGNDNNSGKSPTAAWQTIAKVNSSTFKPGECVLFKAGEVFRGTTLTVPSSGVAGNPIIFGKYGPGANPKFDGTVQYTDWVEHAAPVYKRTDAGADISQVFQDGNRMIYMSTVAGMPAGSFCYTGGVVYVRMTDDSNPNTKTVEYGTQDNGFGIALNGKSHILIDYIDFYRHNYAGVCTDQTGTSDIIIRNSHGSWGCREFLIGVNAAGVAKYPTDITIQNCVGHDDLDVPFWMGHGTRLVCEYCESYNNGLDVTPGGKLYPTTHAPNQILISAEGTDCVVRGCYVHDPYKNGACLDERSGGLVSSGSIWERNKIDCSMSALTAIKTEGTNTVVRNNIIYHNTGLGISLDSNTPASAKFYHNTLIATAAGANHSAYFAVGSNTEFKNNIVYRIGTTNRHLSVPLAGQTGFVANNNDYYGGTLRLFWGPTEYTTLANWRTNSGQDAQGMNADPVFVTANTDLHLQSGSTLRDAGINSLVTDDYDGVIRAAFDIGAYEFV